MDRVDQLRDFHNLTTYNRILSFVNDIIDNQNNSNLSIPELLSLCLISFRHYQSQQPIENEAANNCTLVKQIHELLLKLELKKVFELCQSESNEKSDIETIILELLNKTSHYDIQNLSNHQPLTRNNFLYFITYLMVLNLHQIVRELYVILFKPISHSSTICHRIGIRSYEPLTTMQEFYPELIVDNLSSRYVDVREYFQSQMKTTSSTSSKNYKRNKYIIENIKSIGISSVFDEHGRDQLFSVIAKTVDRIKKLKHITLTRIDIIFLVITRVLECISIYETSEVQEQTFKSVMSLVDQICAYKLYVYFNTDELNKHLFNLEYLSRKFHSENSLKFRKLLKNLHVIRLKVIGLNIPLIADEGTSIVWHFYLIEPPRQRFTPDVLKDESREQWIAKFKRYPSLDCALQVFDANCVVCFESLLEVSDVVILNSCDHVMCIWCSKNWCERGNAT